MMNALLGSVSYAAMTAGAPPADFIDESFVLDETKKASFYVISDAGKTLTNVGGGNDYRFWVPTTEPIPFENQIFYWEIHCLPAGVAAYDGYLGVATLEQVNSAVYGPTTANNPIELGSIGYRGNGTIWAINATQQVTGLVTYGNGSIVMIAFNPVTKGFWVGKNGVWHRNPETETPSYSAPSASVTWFPYVQGRNTSSGGTIKTIPSEFTYPIPSNAKALGRTELFSEIRVPMNRLYSVLGKGSDTLTVHQAKTFAIVGKNDASITLHSSRIYLVVEP